LKKVITVQLAIALIFIALSGCSSNSANTDSQANNASDAASVSINSSTSAVQTNSSVSQQIQSSNSSSAAKNTVSENLNALNSNGQSIERMLSGIANDNADISISDSQSSDADSIANQLNSYLNANSDNISGLNN
jgi:uncharacterized protein YceK